MIIIRPGVFPVTLKTKDMRAKTSIYDFSFMRSGYGHYKVTYTSPVTGKQWTATTNDMPLIDATKNADEPKRRDLETLKRVCKNQ
jgi:hypothetical protein